MEYLTYLVFIKKPRELHLKDGVMLWSRVTITCLDQKLVKVAVKQQ